MIGVNSVTTLVDASSYSIGYLSITTPVVQPVVVGAEQHQVVEVGGSAVFPVDEVVGG